VALTLAQVQEHGLPSTPLKESEKRADKWREAWGHEQTEIDALAALQPETLRAIAKDAIKPFWDDSLNGRTTRARDELMEAANAALKAHPDYEDACLEIESALEELESAKQELADAEDNAREKLESIRISNFVPPEPEIKVEPPKPMFTTTDDFTDATLSLIARKKLIPDGEDLG